MRKNAGSRSRLVGSSDELREAGGSHWGHAVLVVVSGMVAVAAGCAPSIMVPRQKPAEINLRGVKQVAITGIVGSGGDELEGVVLEQLQSSNRFVVVERAQLDKVRKELGVGTSVEFQEGNVTVGKLLPAAALIWGRIDRSDFDQKSNTSNSTCSKVVKRGKKLTTQDYPCRKSERTGKASMSVQFRVFDTNTARILAAKTLTNEQTARTQAEGAEAEPIDGEALKQKCRQAIAEGFLRVIAPYEVKEKVKLVEEGSLPEIKQGNEYLKRGDNQTALEFYGKALARANGDATVSPKAKASANYAHGLGLALVGDYHTALEEMRTANTIVSDSDWLDAEIQIKQWDAEARKVEEQRKSSETPIETAAASPPETAPGGERLKAP